MVRNATTKARRHEGIQRVLSNSCFRDFWLHYSDATAGERSDLKRMAEEAMQQLMSAFGFVLLALAGGNCLNRTRWASPWGTCTITCVMSRRTRSSGSRWAGKPARLGSTEVVKFPGVLIVPDGGSVSRRDERIGRQSRRVPRAVVREGRGGGLHGAAAGAVPGRGIDQHAGRRTDRAVRKLGNQPDLHARFRTN